ASSRSILQKFANGTVTARTFDPQRAWLNQTVTCTNNAIPLSTGCPSGSVVIQNTTYARDAESKIQTITSAFGDEGWTYTYDELHRLTGATDPTNSANNQTWNYDLIGNITSNSLLGTYGYNPAGSA